MAEVGLLARVVAGARARLSGVPPNVPVCRTADDLVGLQPLDLVLIPNATEPIPAYMAQSLLPPPPAPESAAGAIAWRRSTHRFWDPRRRDGPGRYDWKPVP
jgi:hypothetical protein